MSEEKNIKSNFFTKKKIIVLIAVILVVGIVVAVILINQPKEKELDKTVNRAFNENTGNNAVVNTNANVKQGNINQNTNSSQQGKVTGKSTGKIPYASVDQKNTASQVFDYRGGVLTATLPKNIKAYLIIPEDEIIQGATVSLIPYTAMPSSEKHGLLSDEYGYGVQVEIKSLQMGIRGYLVFDTTGGKATEEAAGKSKYYNRCDPQFSWFDPYLCAKKNKVAADKVIDKNSTVITPIHVEKFNNLVFTQNTIPTGIDSLIALRIERGDVYIPQKLDKELAERLVENTISENSSDSQKLEAAALALEWDINKWSQGQIELISDLVEGEYYEESVKAMYILKQYATNIKAGNFAITRGDFDDETDEELATFMENDLDDTAGTFFEDALDVTKYFDFGIESIEAAAAVYDAKGLGVEGASQAVDEVNRNISSTTSSGSSSLGTRSSALESSEYNNSNEPGLTPEALQQIALDVFNHVYADPNATIEEILNAMELVLATGLENADELIEKGMEKIREILEEMLKEAKYKKDFLDIAEIAGLLGFDDIFDKAMAGAIAAPLSAEFCDLVKKNLSNYGINICGDD